MRDLRVSPLRAGIAGIVLITALVAGCNRVTEPLLEFTDPDIINPADLASADGAEALRLGALSRFASMTSATTPGSDNIYLMGGLLADEWRSSDTFQQRNETDQRNIDTTNTFIDGAFRSVGRATTAARQALTYLRQYKPTPRGHQGQMFFFIGFAENLAAETFCSGIPFSDVANGVVTYGSPLTTQQTFERAVASFDSAIANAPDSARFRHAAAVGKGRALLNLGRHADAAAAVAGVPPGFAYLVTHSVTTQDNGIWLLNNNATRYAVANNDGGNGLPFVTAGDPRLPVSIGGRDQEGRPNHTKQLKFPTRESPVPAASYTEARLIIAEAQLKAGDPAWLTTLNALRATVGMTALADPGTDAARVDLLFRERAFWLFGTGHRLGDLRRLIRQYNRGPETVFPTGIFPKGGTYGTDVNLPIPVSERNNPNYRAACDKTQA